VKHIVTAIGIIILTNGCVPKEETFLTFTGDMVYSFLQKDTTYSEYIKIVDKAGLKGMLSAYGEYTCLAPTNSAFRIYYQSFNHKYNFDSLSMERIDYLAKTHIIESRILTSDLENGVLQRANMNNRYIEVKFSNNEITNSFQILLNNESVIISKDNEVYNGVIQGIDHVLKPSEVQLPELIASNPELSIFSEALQLTDLSDSLRLVEDKSYVREFGFLDIYGKVNGPTPFFKKFGYTAFVENNNTFKANGINSLDDLIAKAEQIYPSDSKYKTDFTNRNNSLNKFISYHLVEKVIYRNKFFYDRNRTEGAELFEFIESMYSNRIMKAESNFRTSAGSIIVLNNGTEQEVVVEENGGNATLNGVYHLVDNLLYYSDDVENMLTNTRIRFDIASLFPELANNGLRCSETGVSGGNAPDEWVMPKNYLKYVKTSTETSLYYLSGPPKGWYAHQADQLMGIGNYDITIRLLPVPPGTYEFRFGYTANSIRSVTQIYFDNKPIGIPLDLRIASADPKIGYILDTETDDNGYENDKMMRNRGYMKGPTSIFNYGPEITQRDYPNAIRRVLGTFTFNDYTPHTIRFRSVLDKSNAQGMLDYFEYVPKNIFNPTTGEPETRE
jgi:uncharacterized surface protein with fasciclin (FAS1) repeats